jgi:predicted transcriptional regulator
MMNVYNGNVVTDASGKAIVDLPGYFEAENKDFKYQLTVIGQFAQAIIGEEIKSNQFTILTDKPNVKVSWQVTGVRNDAFAQKNRIVPEVEKTGGEKGKYLYPELYGQSREVAITFMKTGLPTFQGEGKSSASAASRATENKAMARVNDGVEQKRRMLSSQVEQSTTQTATLSGSKPADNSMKMSVEKTKQLAATIDMKQPETKVQEQQKSTATPSTSDKAKQLSTMIETAQAAAQKKIEETKARPVPTSSEKVKQLATSTAVSKEEGNNKVDKAKLPTDSLKITVDQSQKAGTKSQTPASAADVKKLSKPEIKLPAIEKPNAKKD